MLHSRRCGLCYFLPLRGSAYRQYFQQSRPSRCLTSSCGFSTTITHFLNCVALIGVLRHRCTVNASARPITNDELFRVLCEMIRPLDDGHVFISQGDKHCIASSAVPWRN